MNSFRCMLVAVAVFAATVAAYLPGMRAGFYFDDRPNILETPAMHWAEWSVDGVRSVFREARNPTRFVANLSFALNHLIVGLRPGGYHWTNLGIHIAVGGVLIWVGLLYTAQSLADPADRRRASISAVLMTGWFLLHPLNVQAVTYVVQRMTALATLFVLLAFACYLYARDSGPGKRRAVLFGLAGLCWVLAVGGKEIALALPAVIALYEATVRRADWRRMASRQSKPAVTVWLVTGFVATGLFAAAVFALYYDADRIGWNERLPGRDYSGYERILTQPRVHLLYLRLLAWPAPGHLNLEHEFEPSVSPLEAATASSIAIWLTVLVAAGRLAAVRPRYGFPMLAYLAFHLIESGPVNLELVFEHRMYLPMTMLVLLSAAVMTDLPQRYRVPSAAAVIAVGVALGAATYVRNQTWSDPVAFHADCATKSPGKFRPWYNFGTLLGRLGRYREAETALRQALRIKPGDSQTNNQLGNVHLLTHRRDQAFPFYEAAVRADPNNAEAVYNLAKELEAKARMEEALMLYRRFVRIAPPWLESYRRQVAAGLEALAPPSE